MGFGTAASENVFFIGALVVATGLVAAFGTVVQHLAGSMDARGESMAQGLRSDIAVINDAQNVQASPLTLYVKNTGSANLLVDATDVLVDGAVSGDRTFDVLGSADDATWRPAEVLRIVVNDLTVGAGDHVVKVVAESGASAVFEFNEP